MVPQLTGDKLYKMLDWMKEYVVNELGGVRPIWAEFVSYPHYEDFYVRSKDNEKVGIQINWTLMGDDYSDEYYYPTIELFIYWVDLETMPDPGPDELLFYGSIQSEEDFKKILELIGSPDNVSKYHIED